MDNWVWQTNCWYIVQKTTKFADNYCPNKRVLLFVQDVVIVDIVMTQACVFFKWKPLEDIIISPAKVLCS